MRAFAFQSRSGQIVLTTAPDGVNLPMGEGSWEYVTSVDVDPVVPVLGFDPRKALAELRETGLYLVPGKR